MRGQGFAQAGVIALGAVAVAIAVIVDDHEALAVMFGFTGMATAVLGLLLPQLDGEFELSPKGLKGRFRQARALLQQEALTLAEKGEALSELLLDGGSADKSASGSSSDNGTGELALVSIPTFDWPEPPAPGMLSIRHVGRDFASHVRGAFESAGWAVTRVPRGIFGDFVAERADESRLVEVRAARHLSTADVAEMAARRIDDGSPASTKWILVVPADALTAAARRLVDEMQDLDIVSVPIAGANEPAKA